MFEFGFSHGARIWFFFFILHTGKWDGCIWDKILHTIFFHMVALFLDLVLLNISIAIECSFTVSYVIITISLSCSVYNNIHHPSKLAVGADFHCFKNKIEPKWEDPICANGGKWTVSFSRGKSDTSWLYTVCPVTFCSMWLFLSYCYMKCGLLGILSFCWTCTL